MKEGGQRKVKEVRRRKEERTEGRGASEGR